MTVSLPDFLKLAPSLHVYLPSAHDDCTGWYAGFLKHARRMKRGSETYPSGITMRLVEIGKGILKAIFLGLI